MMEFTQLKLASFRAWQLIVLLLIFSGAALVSYFYFSDGNNNPGSLLAEDEQLITARLGDLRDYVSVSGSVVFPIREELSFDITGDVANVFVEEGDFVKLGQKLADIDVMTRVEIEKSIADSAVKVSDAKDALQIALDDPDVLQYAKSLEAVARTELLLKQKQDTLAELKVKDKQEITDARLDAARLEQVHQNSIVELASVENDAEAKIINAKEVLETNRTQYLDTFRRWLGIELAKPELTLNPTTLLDNYQINLNQLFENRDVLSNTSSNSTPIDDPLTPWNEVTVYSWLSLYPGLVKGICPDGAPFQGVCASKEFDDAWEQVSDAVEELDSINLSTSKNIVKSQQAVDKARKEHAKAKEALDALLILEPLELAKADADVKLASANFEDAKRKLIEIEAESDNFDLALLRAKLNYEEKALIDFSTQLENTNLVAPFSGTVDLVSMNSGDRSNQANTYIELVDTSVVQIHGSVDEIDVLPLKSGMPVVISMTSLPERQFDGSIKRIGTASNGQNNLVTFPVEIQMTVPSNIVVREGLTATVDIVLEEYREVLIVPTSSISGSFVAPTVRVMVGNSILERPVRLGPSDDFWVIIERGITEGDRVIMPEPASANTQSSGFRGLIGRGSSRGSNRGGGSGNRGN